MKNTINIIILLLFILSCSCKQKTIFSTYNDGGYEFVKYYDHLLNVQDSTLIYGKISDIENKQNSINGYVQLGCQKVDITNGSYRYKSKSFNIDIQLKVIALGFLTVETKPFRLNAGDSLMVNFYLSEDKRPLINCEGQ